MPKLLVLGSSHAQRIFNAIQRSNLYKKYEILTCFKSGARIFDLDLSIIAQLSKDDIVIIQLFGNEILKKAIQIERRSNGGKTIHLTKFSPCPQEKIQQGYKKLLQALNSNQSILSSNVFIIDNAIRHLNCCKNHVFKGLFAFQAKQNKILARTFKKFNVLDHRRLIGSKRSVKRSYYEMFFDTVHFRSEVYDTLVRNLRAKF